jgi:hypothetical protein
MHQNALRLLLGLPPKIKEVVIYCCAMEGAPLNECDRKTEVAGSSPAMLAMGIRSPRLRVAQMAEHRVAVNSPTPRHSRHRFPPIPRRINSHSTYQVPSALCTGNLPCVGHGRRRRPGNENAIKVKF